MKFHVRDTILLWQTCTNITCLQIQSVPMSRTIIVVMMDGMSSLVSECLIQMAMVEEYQNKWKKKKDWTCRMVLFPPYFFLLCLFSRLPDSFLPCGQLHHDRSMCCLDGQYVNACNGHQLASQILLVRNM